MLQLTSSAADRRVRDVCIYLATYISFVGVVSLFIADLVPYPIPAFAFTVDDTFVAALPRDRDFADPLVDVTHDFLYH